jgi:hypothetical protein
LGFEKQMDKSFIAHRYQYSVNEKEIYIVSVKDLIEAKEVGLKFLNFAVLYLCDITRHIETIQSWNPNSGDPGFIIAYDNSISTFSPGKILGVDVSMGDPLFVWKECRVSPYDFPDSHYFLMEKSS